jgi:hypothetical protein
VGSCNRTLPESEMAVKFGGSALGACHRCDSSNRKSCAECGNELSVRDHIHIRENFFGPSTAICRKCWYDTRARAEASKRMKQVWAFCDIAWEKNGERR